MKKKKVVMNKLSAQERQFLTLVINHPGKSLGRESWEWIKTEEGMKAKALWFKPMELGLIKQTEMYTWYPTEKLIRLAA